MKILIVEARFYNDIADQLLGGAKNALKSEGYQFDVVTVPGALEIPAAINFAADKYAGFVALGCVIRGETYHFDVVSNESARGIMDLTINKKLAIGNGILTVENEEQAFLRAKELDKGGFAAKTCIELIKLKSLYDK